MRALVLGGVRDIIVADHPDPVLEGSDEAIVRVEAAGLCGSDLHPYLGREPAAPGVVAGHEAVGEIVAVGSGVRGFETGDRVIVPFTASCGRCPACASGLTARCARSQLFGWGDRDDTARRLDGCQAELVRIPLASSTLVRCPDVSASHAVLLADNLPTAWEAFDRTRYRDGTLAVVGLGSVGLCAVALATSMGVTDVVAFDPVAMRAAIAESLGARIVDQSTVTEIGATAVIEAAGNAPAQRMALALTRPGARISMISVQTDDSFAITPVEAYDQNLTLSLGRASVRSTLEERLADLSAVDRRSVSAIVDRPGLPLSEGPETYRAFADRRFVKATFHPRSVGSR